MASLQKTFTGDLTTAIAGKLYEAIKDIDDKNQLEKSGASEDVKKAAVKTKKEDPNSVLVRDKDLRETIVNFFTPISGKLIKAQATYSAISSKVTTLAGGVADTQKLLINQNQILEDKFDQILSVIGTKNAIEAKLKAENDFKQMELNLEKGLDLSGTFAYDKAGGRSSMGLVGSVLQGILGNRMTARLVRNLYQKIVPKGLRARGRLLRKTIKPFGRVTKFALTPLKSGIRAAVTSSAKIAIASGVNVLKKQVGRRGLLKSLGRIIVSDTLPRLGGPAMGVGKRSLGQAFRSSVAKRGLDPLGLGKLGYGLSVLGGYSKLFLSGKPGANKIAEQIIDAYATRATLLMNQAAAAKQLGVNFTKQGRSQLKMLQEVLPYGKILGGATEQLDLFPQVGKSSGRKITKELASNKQSASAATNLAEEVLGSKGLFKYLKNPAIQRKLAKKLGKEGLEKLLSKSGVAAAKNVAVGPGTIYSFVEGLARMSPLFGGSDPTGMLLSFGSAIPFAGWGVIVADILRDIDRDAFDAHILPNILNLQEENFQDFFTQSLNLDTSQFERGTPNISSNMLGGIDSISEILGVTKAFGQATGFGGEIQGLIGEAGLGSYPTGKSDYSFDVSGNIGGGNIEQIQSEEDELREKQRYKEEKKKEEVEKEQDEVKTNPVMNRVRDFTGGEVGDGVFTLPFGVEIPNIFHRGGGGIGGDDNIQTTTPIMGGDGATIEFWGQQGRDLSGEPGVDFSYKDYKSNYNLFPGYVLEKGLLYGARYGNVVVVRSVDPSNGLEFDSLYSHFPDGGMAVKTGQVVSAGEYLGKVGFVSVDVPGVPQMQPNNAGNMSGWHTSVDFFEPGSAARYRNLSVIQNLVTGADGQTPVGLLNKLKPPAKSSNQSSLNSIGANTKLASTMTNMVENGSSERLMTQREISNRLPIVILNNQIIKSSTTAINIGSNNTEDNFFEAYNLARHTV